MFGQLLDSDFGDGNTDTNGMCFAAVTRLPATGPSTRALFLNDLSNDVPQSVTVFNEATPAPVRHHGHHPALMTVITSALQLDLNFRF